MASLLQHIERIERWLPVPGHEGSYEVSDHGRVRSLPRTVIHSNGVRQPLNGRLLKAARTSLGYEVITLPRGNGILSGRTHVHTLVLTTFVGPCPPGMECCHANDIPWDNRLVNLRWDTPVANAADKRRNGGLYQLRRTHCPQGHEFTPENTYYKPSDRGARRCRTCVKKASHERYLRRRGATA